MGYGITWGYGIRWGREGLHTLHGGGRDNMGEGGVTWGREG